MTDETIYPWEYENRVYRIYLGENHTYSLMEEDEWYEFHKVDILNNATYEYHLLHRLKHLIDNET